MKSSKLHSYFQYCLLVVVVLMTANLALPSTVYWAGEMEEEWSEWNKEIDAETDYEFGDGDDENTTTYLLPTAYWTPSKLFVFLGENNSNTIRASIDTIAKAFPNKLYLLFQHLKLDC